MRLITVSFGILAASLLNMAQAATPLGLPPVPVPPDNPMTPAKIKLGDKLFHDKRFSTDGTVSCATCHDVKKAFTDSPLKVSQGIGKLTGTRNAPTVVNAAYMHTQFWDGREPDLEGQSAGPFINPVEMGLPNHRPILKDRPQRSGIQEAVQKGLQKDRQADQDETCAAGHCLLRTDHHLRQFSRLIVTTLAVTSVP